ncbi:DUF7018 domain-containing (lipo)protein [Bacillus paramycoides]|uniref:DUF7018 domain-containing (lipo)protein n=1 Tax=Bacillus paramycoides TaxID=2026194 RepID=UPI00380AACB2
MKAKKLVSLARPILLLVGVSEKSSEPKTETVSNEDKKEKISEERYPYYVFELLVDFTSQLDSYSSTVKSAFSGGANVSQIMDSIDSIEYVLDEYDKIQAPSKYESSHKDLISGVDEIRKGLDLLADSIKLYEKGDVENRNKGTQEGMDVIKHGESMWKPVFSSLHSEYPDVYEKALLNNGSNG